MKKNKNNDKVEKFKYSFTIPELKKDKYSIILINGINYSPAPLITNDKKIDFVLLVTQKFWPKAKFRTGKKTVVRDIYIPSWEPGVRMAESITRKEYIEFWPTLKKIIAKRYDRKMSAQPKMYDERDAVAHIRHYLYKESYKHIYERNLMPPYSEKGMIFPSVEAVKKAIKRIGRPESRFWKMNWINRLGPKNPFLGTEYPLK